MIKFFRKIRQKLLAQNRFSKYLLYAIGEIVLVVIGILIALQINNWNENRKRIAEKNGYCKQLIASLRSDLSSLENFGARLAKLEDKGIYLWEYVNGSKSEIDTNLFKNHFLNAANAFDFTPKTTSYENLVASNGLGLLRSNTLKDMMALYFVPQKGAKEVAQQRIDYAAAYNDIRFEFVSPMMLKKYLKVLFEENIAKPDSGIGEDEWEMQMETEVDLSEFNLAWEKLKNSKIYKTYLGRMLAVREPQIDDIKKTNDLISEMIELLEKEIQ